MEFKTKPYRHQIECLNRFGRYPAFALLAEMGTGKTWIMINNLAFLWGAGDCYGALILAPNGVHSNWARLELPMHAPVGFDYYACVWNAKNTKAQNAALNHLFDDCNREKFKILLMNHEALQTKKGFEFAAKFLKNCTHPQFHNARPALILDESDGFKNPKAIRTKNLLKLKPLTAWRRIMSGTPINNSPFDLFTQFAFLDERILKCPNYYAFKAEYGVFLPDNHPLVGALRRKSTGGFIPKIEARDAAGKPIYKNLEKLQALIQPVSYFVKKADCLDLPPKIYKNLFFDLTQNQRAIYERLKADGTLILENEQAARVEKLACLQKLAQVTSGYYLHPESGEIVAIEGENPKLDLLIEYVQKSVFLGEKCIVWARYRAEIAAIVERLKAAGVECVEYHGGVDTAERAKAIDAFQNGAAKVFVGNQQAGGTGITLTAASVVFYFSNNFSLRDRLQSEDRAHRIGQSKSVVYFNISAKNTIDEGVVRALANKGDILESVIRERAF